MKKLLAVGFTMLAAQAYAGQATTSGWATSIYHNADGTIQVSGTLGGTRASSDTHSYIGCLLDTYPMSDGSLRQLAICYGHDAGKDYISCVAEDPKLISTVQFLRNDSAMTFYTTTPVGSEIPACTSININTDSSTRPKTL